jgi:DNA modification methylase
MVEPAYEYVDGFLYHGNVNDVLAELPECSVDCIVTSPPYFGLRDYGTATWVGGDADCTHEVGRHMRGGTLDGKESNFQNNSMGSYGDEAVKIGDSCPHCSAVRKDLQVGLEQTPEQYIARMVDVFRGLRRVLKADGVAWLNLGDTYWGGKGRSGAGSKKTHKTRTSKTLQKEHTYIGEDGGFRPQDRPSDIFKAKDLCMMPHRVAIALQEDGWWVRQDIVWNKTNPMPESIRDRCTKSHEYMFMLTKSKKYYFDNQSIKEPAVSKPHNSGNKSTGKIGTSKRTGGQLEPDRVWASDGMRNRRSVWTISTRPYKGAHFATFPPKLIEPCILGGTSEKGHCSKCGSRWKRNLKRNIDNKTDTAKSLIEAATHMGIPDDKAKLRIGLDRKTPYEKNPGYQLLGFEPTCDCDAECDADVVLDPFMGSGTTAIVARQHGRRFIGIDLNKEYLALANGRIEND